jgi:hypothetical protein
LKDWLTNCDSVSWDFTLFWRSCGSVSAISFIVYISCFYALFTYKIFQFLKLIPWYWIIVCKALFTWDQDETKLEWKLKLSTYLHETGMKITKFSIYFPCQAIFFFRMAFVSMCCSLVPMSTFIPVWIDAGLKSVGLVQQAEWLATSCKHLLYIILWPKLQPI